MTAAAPAPADGLGLPPGARGWAVLAMGTGVAMATLDTAIANIALPTIAGSLHTSAEASVWVVTSYQLVMVATLLPFAALGEVVGYRRVYALGLALFTVASLGCALAWSLPSLAAARALQGLGGSAAMAVNGALIRYIYPSARLGSGMGLNALIVATSFVVGPTVASSILLVAPWPWLFAVNVPFGVAALLLALRKLPDNPRSTHGFDSIAAVLSAGFLGLLGTALGEASHGAPLPRVLAEAAGALACGALLMRRQAGHAAPMLAVDLFRRPVFALSAATSVCSFTAQSLAFVSLPFLFEEVLHRSTVETGFLITPWSVMVALMAPVAGRLSDRYAPGVLGGVGLAVLCVGMALLAGLPAQPGVFDIGWRMMVCGAGFGFFQSPNLKALMSSAPRHRSGGASGIVATARLFGQSTGAALVAACFGLLGTGGSTAALILGSGFAAAASVASFLRLLARDPSPPGPG